MRKAISAILVATVVVTMGCADQNDISPCVKISPTISTRVSGVHFDEGDRIGLTILRGTECYAENKMMTYDGAAFTASDLLWYDNLNDKSTLTAYYPYSASGVPSEFSVAADQTEGCTGSDLLAAVKTEVAPVSTPVGMLFHHLMSQLTIVIKNDSDAAVSAVVVGGLIPTAEIDLAVPSARVKAGEQAVEIKAYAVESNAGYRVVVVPQQAELTVTVSTENGKSHSKTIPGATLESGFRYDLSVTVTNIDISLSLSGDIQDWENGGLLGEDDGNTEGTLTWENETYRTRTIGGRVWMADNLRVEPAGVSLGSGMWKPIGGTSAIRTQGMLYNYATATCGASQASGVPMRGICPEGWHIPDVDEMQSLVGMKDERDFFCCASYYASSWYGAENKGYLMCSSLARDGYCNALTFSTEESVAASLSTAKVDFGISVRCVKN